MKFICYKDTISKALNSVVKAVATKTTKPILEGILIQTNENEIKLTTYDMEIGIEYTFQCNIIEHGSTVVNATMFTDIIRKLPNTEINISVNEKNLLIIDCQGSLYKLATMNPDEFPEFPKIEIENSITLEQSALKNLIRKTIFAVSTDDNKPIYTGCLFEVKNNRLNIVAIDGFRLALRNINLPVHVENFKAIIPAKTLNEVIKILTDSFEEVRIGISKNQALFEMENCKLITRTFEGEFLNYLSVIPSSWQTRVKVNRMDLLNSFERISLISSSTIEKEKKCPVNVFIDIGKMTISCINQTGDAKEDVFISTEGQSLEIGFNPKYFLDCLKSIDDEEVFIEFGSNISPCIIKAIDNNDYTYMILPIRLKNN